MKFSVPLFPLDRWGGVDNLLAAMKRADQLGFGSVTLPEHLINPLSEAGSPMLPGNVFYDVFVLGAAIAAVTTQLTMHISAMIVPYRHPLLAAKLLASLDQFAKGRVKVTVAAGWMEEEFAALGLDFKDRAAMTGEYLTAMQRIWREPTPSFSGRFMSFAPCKAEPKCYREPHVKLLGGGHGPLALRRVLDHCTGWAPMSMSPQDMRPSIDWLFANALKHGREPETLEFWTRINILGGDSAITAASSHVHGAVQAETSASDSDIENIVKTVQSYQALGNFPELALTFPWRSPAEYIERLEWFAAEVAPNLT